MTRWHSPEEKARLAAEKQRAAQRHKEQAAVIDEAIRSRIGREREQHRAQVTA